MKLSLDNLQINIETRLMIEKTDIETGKRRLTVSNQFDGYVVESALANCTKERIEATIERCNVLEPFRIGTMEWAHMLSEYEAPEIDRSWVD
tara:strand:- start:1104 stop:1379 length:276 start_codon:yes stop_codon:yes gene_type:complete